MLWVRVRASVCVMYGCSCTGQATILKSLDSNLGLRTYTHPQQTATLYQDASNRLVQQTLSLLLPLLERRSSGNNKASLKIGF
jgi:hypothetical protein